MQNLVIDISRRGVIPPIIVTEYDSMSRFFELRLLNNGADYTPPENANYSVWYETNDSKGWYDTITLPDETSRPAVVEDGNVLTVEIAEAATTSCGELAVMVTGNGGYQLTVSGIRLMSADVPGYDGAEVTDYYNVYIADMQKNAARAENAAQTAIEYGATIDVEDETLIIDHYDDAGEVETWATVSEAWAVGKRNGVDVPSTDETYHNNSKYYAGQAGTAASAAASSASSASSSASSASNSASSANSSKTAAANSATAAASSAANAGTSASQAATSATSAASANTSAQAAKTAAEAAAAEASLYKATVITEEASGTIARFEDGADDIPMQSLVAEITPVQSGTGDPSPTNIRPISGRTGLTVTRAGKNILNPSAMVRGSVFVDNGDGTYTFSKVGTGASGRITWSSPIKADDGTTVTFSANITGTHESEIYIGFVLNESTGGTSAECIISNGRITGTVTSTSHMDGIRLYWRNNSTGVGTDSVVLSNMQVEYGGVVTDYEAPSIATIPITWESIAGTVYGGTLDVVSGVLTVDKYYLTCADTITPNVGAYAYATNPNRWQIPLSGDYMPSEDKMGESISDTFGYYSGGFSQWADGTFRFSTIQSGMYRLIQFKWDGQPSTVADLQTFLAENPIHFVIPFATPQTYQLTPTEVRTLLGGNNIYTDAGYVSVEYVADTKLYIDNKITELQALILEH